MIVSAMRRLRSAGSPGQVKKPLGMGHQGSLVGRLFTFLCVGACLLLWPGCGQSTSPSLPDDSPLLAAKPLAALNVPLTPPLDLNFKSKADIYGIRRNAVLQYPTLVKRFQLKGYRPDDFVFRQIEDKKPWWGILGLSYYGPGDRSIEGPSEESRYLANPFLLLGVDELLAHPLQGPIPDSEGFYPQPVSLLWDAQSAYGWVTYDISTFLEKDARIGCQNAQKKQFYFIDYNSRDLGVPYFYAVPEKLTGGELVVGSKTEYHTSFQYIHTGPSCGYPGGCNNMSGPALSIIIHSLPARVYFKLWHKQPKALSDPASAWFVVEMI